MSLMPCDLTSTLDIEQVGRTRTPSGGIVESPQLVASNVPCRWSAGRASESIDAGGTRAALRGTLYVNADVDLSSSGRIRHGGRVFDIDGVTPIGQDSGRPEYWRIDVSEALPDADD